MVESISAAKRYETAEQKGLRLAILCRTLIAAAGILYLVIVVLFTHYDLRYWALAALVIVFLTGVVHLSLIGTIWDRWWIKFLIYMFDALLICALFVVIPVSRADDVPQIIAFRAYGIYYLFPLVTLSALSLSWRLVIWTGFCSVAGWWACFWWVVRGMENTLSWTDIPSDATLEHYETVFLSMDFIGRGNRVEETGFLFVSTLILALVVYRARAVFFAQIAAEESQQRERAEKLKIRQTLGQFVPEQVAEQIVLDDGILQPQEGKGSVLILDIADFTRFASDKSPVEVIDALNDFLAECTAIITGNSGVVISFTGDGLMATFNTPLALKQPEQTAVETARQLVEAAASTRFKVRIGVATGPVASGSIGSAERKEFTVYGTTVNKAARLEALCKRIGETVLIDHSTHSALADASHLHEVGEHELRGVQQAETIFALRDA